MAAGDVVRDAVAATASDDICGRAMLVNLHVSAWSARRFDKKVSDEVNEERGASQSAGRYNKHLFGGKVEVHSEVLNAANAARNMHYEQTLPWSDAGWRLLPTANFFEYTSALRKAEYRFDNAWRAFVDAYPRLREEARVALNGLYRDADYPAASEIRNRFRFRADYMPIAQKGDFRVGLPQDQIDAIEGQLADRVREATETAMRDAWNRLYEVAAKFHARLSDPDNTPKKTLIEGGRDVAAMLRRLNIANDAALDAMIERVERELLNHDAEELREVPGLKQSTASRAQQILSAMQAAYGGPGAEQ